MLNHLGRVSLASSKGLRLRCATTWHHQMLVQGTIHHGERTPWRSLMSVCTTPQMGLADSALHCFLAHIRRSSLAIERDALFGTPYFLLQSTKPPTLALTEPHRYRYTGGMSLGRTGTPH